MKRNRTALGLICVILAAVVTFVIGPLITKVSSQTTTIVRAKTNITQGNMLTEDNTEMVEVGGLNLPSNVIKKQESVLGQYATCDMKEGDYFMPSKITKTGDNIDEVLKTLNGEKQAISITIPSFAGGFSGKLKNGDIISIIVYDEVSKQTVCPNDLKYLKVITTTTSTGIDNDELAKSDEGEEEDLPSTITVLVTQKQAQLLVQYENTGKLHAEFVYRGDEATANKFLEEQKRLLG